MFAVVNSPVVHEASTASSVSPALCSASLLLKARSPGCVKQAGKKNTALMNELSRHAQACTALTEKGIYDDDQ